MSNENTRNTEQLETFMTGAATAIFTSTDRKDFYEVYEALCECEEDYPDDIYPWEPFADCDADSLAGQIDSEGEFLARMTEAMLEQIQQTLTAKGVDLKGLILVELVDAQQAPWANLDKN